MAKYLYLWELDKNKIPVDPKERGAGWQLLIDAVKRDFDKGLMKDWGAFVGEHKGYFVAEGSELEVGLAIEQYVPYVSFKAHPVSTVSQIDELLGQISK